MSPEATRGHALFDGVAALAIAMFVVLPLLAEFGSWLARQRQELRRERLCAELSRWRGALEIEAEPTGAPTVALGESGVKAERGSEALFSLTEMPGGAEGRVGNGRLAWELGEEVQCITLEVEENGVRCRVSLALPIWE